MIHADPIAYPPRGLSRIEAARYIGIGLHLFDDLVKEGRLPPPKVINRRIVFDRIALDVAFSGLPDQDMDTRSRLQKQMDANPA